MIRRNDPLDGPEIVSGGAARGMLAVLRGELSTIGQLDDDALEPFVVHLRASLVEDADAPGDRLLALELVGQHTERPSLVGLTAADHVAFEKELLCSRILSVGGRRQCKADNGQGENAQSMQASHDTPFRRWPAADFFGPLAEIFAYCSTFGIS